MCLKTLCIFGTRPEAIKMAPLIKELDANGYFSNKNCITAQHRRMLDAVLDLFEITPHFDLNVMTANQNLSMLTSKILLGLETVFEKYRPQLVFVHGDTTTTLAAALSAYYHKIPIVHIEAGLRSGNMYSPWPEEVNRKLTGHLAGIHFAPTVVACENLLREGIAKESIFVTGNTVIDALYEIKKRIEQRPSLSAEILKAFPFLDNTRKKIVVTTHRRENFGEGFKRISKALIQISESFPEVDIIYPLHLNPNVQKIVKPLLQDIKNIYLIAPLEYLPFVLLMEKAYLILTDSGGIQEEALALNKPMLVLREETERPEALQVGLAKLVGTEIKTIVDAVSHLLQNEAYYQKLKKIKNPYGDGQAASHIVKILMEKFK